uniref:Uncharacterized protein n=1 Tax=Acrobeloides nanus TaxID=290746 RepID=A0A914EF59_9BILA
MECIEKMRTLIYKLDKIDSLEDSLKKANKLEDGEVMEILNPSVKVFKQELIEHITSEKAEKPQISKDQLPTKKNCHTHHLLLMNRLQEEDQLRQEFSWKNLRNQDERNPMNVTQRKNSGPKEVQNMDLLQLGAEALEELRQASPELHQTLQEELYHFFGVSCRDTLGFEVSRHETLFSALAVVT